MLHSCICNVTGPELQWVINVSANALVMVQGNQRTQRGLNSYTCFLLCHYCDIIMGAMMSQITSLMIVYSTFIQAQIKKKKLRVTGLFAGNSPVTGEFPAQMASNAEYVSIWWRHHVSLAIVDFDSPLLIEWCHSKWRTKFREIARPLAC